MENHPIPQDITSFQFRLIGNMTIKQFAYVGFGVVIGWFFYALPFPVFLTYPFALFSVITGFFLAFIPVEGRPFDSMIANFLRALFVPNQYIFQKTDVPVLQAFPVQKIAEKQKEQRPTISKDVLHTYLQQTPHVQNALDQKETAFFSIVAAFTPAVAPHTMPSYVPPTVSVPQAPKAPPYKVDLPEDDHKTQQDAVQQDTVKETQPAPAIAPQVQTAVQPVQETEGQPVAHVAPATPGVETQLQEALKQKQQLEQQLQALQQQFATKQTPVPTVVAAPAPAAIATPVASPVQTPVTTPPAVPAPAAVIPPTQVKKIAKPVQKPASLPIMPDAPNLIIGVVKNPRGNILSNMLVEVKDQQGNPVRAFKTNAIGQFASATSLPNGIYTIEFEDPKGENTFDAIQLTAEGAIMQPLEIISQDQRESLRQALFTQAKPV